MCCRISALNPDRVPQEVNSLQREVSRWESQARQRERRLAELEQELLEKSVRAETLHRQLEDSARQADDAQRQLEESRRSRGEAEQELALRLREYEEELARQAAAPPKVKVSRRCPGGWGVESG